ncbi:hypothetical protein BJV82DRAFT_607653 [Fennellomyces sp. T-0311]|nr:hypothetical protein BJV82DRAFT_607653 [Fennellomyces sp. T-0311]
MIRSIIELWLSFIDFVTVLIANSAAFLQAVYELGLDEGRGRPVTTAPFPRQPRYNRGTMTTRRTAMRSRRRRPNYIDALPNEILTVVFEMAGSPSDLYQCTVVSHRWHSLVTPILWRAPVLTGPVCCFPPFVISPSSSSPCDYCCDRSDTFPIHLAKYGTAIRKLAMPPQHTTDCSMAHIARSCPNLNELVLDNCKRVSSLGLLFLTRHCRRLELISLNRCVLVDDMGISYLETQQKLKTVRIAGLKHVTSPAVTRLAQALPHLRSLDVSDCTGVTEVRELMRACGTTLTHLNVARLPSLDTDTIVQHCPLLEHLVVARKQRRSERQLNDLIDQLERHNIGLTRLGASLVRRHRARRRQQQKQDPHEIDQTNFLHLVKGLKHLKYLDVSNWDGLDDGLVKDAITGHKITHVRLSGCRHVTVP